MLQRMSVLVPEFTSRDPADAGAAEDEGLVAARGGVGVDPREVDQVAAGDPGALEGEDAAAARMTSRAPGAESATLSKSKTSSPSPP